MPLCVFRVSRQHKRNKTLFEGREGVWTSATPPPGTTLKPADPQKESPKANPGLSLLLSGPYSNSNAIYSPFIHLVAILQDHPLCCV